MTLEELTTAVSEANAAVVTAGNKLDLAQEIINKARDEHDDACQAFFAARNALMEHLAPHPVMRP